MTDMKLTLPFLLLLAMTSPVLAQTADETPETAPDALALSMGDEGVQPGDVYVDSTFTDWEVRCIKAPEGAEDPCQLYQLLRDGDDNPVAEINVFALGGEGQPAAGATIITPLETLLTQQLGMSVDGGQVKKYPFSWCSAVGCFSRVGFSEAEIEAFRRGNNATLIIVPVAAADQTVHLNVSLKGFTAGFKDLAGRRAAAAAAEDSADTPHVEGD